MKFEKEVNDQQIIIRPCGRIDSNTSEEFEAFVNANLDDEHDIVFDFKETEYISSSGLRVILFLRKAYASSKVTFMNVNDVVYDVFDLSGFTGLFTVMKASDSAPDTKVIFFDIDGTLLSPATGQVPESTKEAIRMVQEKGVQAVIATGRDIAEVKKLPLDGIRFDGYLTLNGNICLDENEHMFAGNAIIPEELDVLVNIFKAGKIPFVLIGEKQRYINYVDDVVIQTQLSTHGTVPDIGEYQGENIYQCLAFVDSDVRRKLEDMLDHCTITSWNETGIDIIAKTGGKAAGIQHFLDKEDLTRSQSMAFGDGENDMDMLRYVGVGVAMGNSKEILKQKADYVTTSVDEDGIMNALKHFGLI
ncbi:MAG: Cof-type HAD-IIB family hydrolase [Erysipelotrichaceae bacterium]|nr:Cof-type HAD-IIB family hydrolase [Erysipelotrichaceae bacterium]